MTSPSQSVELAELTDAQVARLEVLRQQAWIQDFPALAYTVGELIRNRRAAAPSPVGLPEDDIAWLHKFINCVPFGADAPSSDIQRAHSIVTAAERRVGELERSIAMQDWNEAMAECRNLQERTEKAERLANETRDHFTREAEAHTECRRDLDAANKALLALEKVVKHHAEGTVNFSDKVFGKDPQPCSFCAEALLLNAAAIALAHREPAGGEE